MPLSTTTSVNFNTPPLTMMAPLVQDDLHSPTQVAKWKSATSHLAKCGSIYSSSVQTESCSTNPVRRFHILVHHHSMTMCFNKRSCQVLRDVRTIAIRFSVVGSDQSVRRVFLAISPSHMWIHMSPLGPNLCHQSRHTFSRDGVANEIAHPLHSNTNLSCNFSRCALTVLVCALHPGFFTSLISAPRRRRSQSQQRNLTLSTHVPSKS